ncbi:MAG TPA: FAD-dependent oxidoreductase [Frankiaceae bacterium]|jgi:2,4-dienoyl-CoA reductase (NADPH2)|nr:FAD-dependent oxidoreductase [Frankiaceae bacterium]
MPGRSNVLGEPIDVGGRTLRSRLVMTPHLGRLRPDRLLRYVEERARHGIAMAVLPAGDAVYNLSGYHDSVTAALGSVHPDADEIAYGIGDEGYRTELLSGLHVRLQRLGGLVQQHGALAIGQIHHPGAEQSWDSFQPVIAPSSLRADASSRIPHAVSVREIDRIVAAHVETAAHIVGAGLDGVELHAGHGYLLNRFLSPYYNQRTDAYGGSPGRRLRLVRRLISEVRERIGPAPLLGIRLPTTEEIPGGLTPADVADIVAELSGELSYVSLSLGNHDGLRDGRPTTAYTSPWLVDAVPAAAAARAIRERASCPVLVTGRVTTPRNAEELIESGAADLVGLARALVADPRFAERAVGGEDAQIVRCIGCNECTLVPFSCPVNPRAGREGELSPRRAATRRRVVVVGAGPAGVGAATTAAARGHDVVLFDSAPEAGGRVALLGRSPVLSAWRSFGVQLQQGVSAAAIDFRPGRRVGAEEIAACEPDAVVIATGSEVGSTGIAGGIEPRSGLEVLAHGRTEADGPVVIVGGPEPHLEPLVVAEAMLAANQPVTLLTEHVTVGPGVEPRTLNFYLGRLLGSGVNVLPVTRALEWRDGALRVVDLYAGRESTLDAAVVIVVRQRHAADALVQEVEQALPVGVPVHLIGDALAPRRMTHAALEGVRIGLVL